MRTKRLINQSSYIQRISSDDLDKLLALGWRHFGHLFFRYNVGLYKQKLCNVIPLRIQLLNYQHSKSQHKIIKKNRFFKTHIQSVNINREKENLFDVHKVRFEENAPTSLLDFISITPNIPTEIHEICVYDDEKLIAYSFLDMGNSSCSSIYGVFHPDYHSYSLGIYTMLVEIEYAMSLQKLYYYHGYCYDIPSFYDYKKRFYMLEAFDWKSKWYPYPKA